MISFIIPTYNEEILLLGILRQLFENKADSKFEYEVIITDGGSNDRTVELALQYPLKIVQPEKGRDNIPIGKNRGASAAIGDIYVFVCADVIFSDLELFLSLISQKVQGKTLAMTFPVYVFPWERKLQDILFHSFYNQYFRFINLIGIGFGRGECQVIAKSLFERIGGFQEQLAAGEDFDLFKRAAFHSKIDFCTKTCIYESPRRYRKFGYLKVVKMWTKNAFSVLSKNESHSKEWEAVR